MDYNERIQEAPGERPLETRILCELAWVRRGTFPAAPSRTVASSFPRSVKLLIAMAAFIFGSGLFGATPKAEAQWEWLLVGGSVGDADIVGDDVEVEEAAAEVGEDAAAEVGEDGEDDRTHSTAYRGRLIIQ